MKTTPPNRIVYLVHWECDTPDCCYDTEGYLRLEEALEEAKTWRPPHQASITYDDGLDEPVTIWYSDWHSNR